MRQSNSGQGAADQPPVGGRWYAGWHQRSCWMGVSSIPLALQSWTQLWAQVWTQVWTQLRTLLRTHLRTQLLPLQLAVPLAMLLAMPGAQAAKVAGVTPQGEVAQVRQISVRFDAAVVPLGDLRRPAPFSVACSGPVPNGEGRWTNEREWVYDFRAALPPGVRCSVRTVPGWKPLEGALESANEYRFSTGGPAVLRSEPWEGANVEEDQHFLLRLNGPAQPASVLSQAWCEIDGIGERIAVRIVEGELRQQILMARRVAPAEADRALLLTCARPLPVAAKLRLVWGEGIAALADPSVKTRSAQRFRYTVRPAFTAEFSCEREKAGAPCMPLRPLVLRFSVPVAKANLQLARLIDAAGKEQAPELDEGMTESSELKFRAPLPENAQLRITLPKELKDASGRALANAASFPLTVATGPAPPIAKFAAAPFGIVEWGPEAMLPLTLRHVQVDLKSRDPKATGATAHSSGAVRMRRIEPREWLKWMGQLQDLQDKEMTSRAQPLLAKDRTVRALDLPQLQGNEPRPFEVVGIPLHEPGYHVIEIESRLLGDRLLAKPAPMYVRTGVLVTNLGVHFKHGRENSLAWVTTLDRAQPVAGAEVTVHDCVGGVLWQGRSDAAGLAHIPQALPSPDAGRKCLWQSGYFVTASVALPASASASASASAAGTGAGSGAAASTATPLRDQAFVFSSWQKGIEPWRFNVQTAMDGGGADVGPNGAGAVLRVHTVLDRMLLRAGESVSMKHLVRTEVGAGLRDTARAELPTKLKIIHIGSGDEVVQPLSFDAAGRAALSSWAIPASAKLGLYELQLHSGQRQWSSGRFRVEEFRLPLIDARLAAPKTVQIAPSSLDMALTLTHQSGGGVARAAVRTSALLRDRDLAFTGYEGYSFRPPREPGRANEDRDEDAANAAAANAEGAKLVIDKQAGSTDAQGATTLKLDKLPALKRAAQLQVEVTFNDPNGEVQTVSTPVALWPAARVVGVRASSWAATKGTVKFQALVLNLDGQPMAGARASVLAR